MSKKETTVDGSAPAEQDVAPKAEAVAAIVPDVQELTLHEFCQRLSGNDKRVELISAFHYAETSAGTIKDVETAFASRFADFINKPA